jgi:hypothetical protein
VELLPSRIRELEAVSVLTEVGLPSHTVENDVDPAHLVCHESVQPEGKAVCGVVVVDAQAVWAQRCTATAAVGKGTDADGTLRGRQRIDPRPTLPRTRRVSS